jgi:hypothetical protein
MPSTTSSSVSRLFASSTVITPSLPTFCIASAIILPIEVSPGADRDDLPLLRLLFGGVRDDDAAFCLRSGLPVCTTASRSGSIACSSAIISPAVSTAMSSSMALRRSPKPGAYSARLNWGVEASSLANLSIGLRSLAQRGVDKAQRGVPIWMGSELS